MSDKPKDLVELYLEVLHAEKNIADQINQLIKAITKP